MSFSLLLNTKDDILKNMGNKQTPLTRTVWKQNTSQCCPSTSLKMSFVETHAGLEQLEGK